MTRRAYLAIGHVAADMTPQGRVLGGTSAYAAQVAAAFGLQPMIWTSAAPDDPLLAALAHQADVDLLPSDHTTTFENIYASAERQQVVRATAARLTPANLPNHLRDQRTNRVPLVHLAPICDDVAPALAHHFADSTVLITLQGWLRRWGADGSVRLRRWFEADVLRKADLVVLSEEDIAAAPDLEAQFARYARHLVVTRAARGGIYYRDSVPMPYAAPMMPQASICDPTGAGDIFAAALLASWPLLESDARWALAVAAQLAALSVTRRGLASAPSAAEVRSALAGSQRRLQVDA
ncbi:MAG: hypothetical protein GYB67_07935 [Chloroflexi bacterium]|nr:hypothetical protein [Chloroflexota bacterium]